MIPRIASWLESCGLVLLACNRLVRVVNVIRRRGGWLMALSLGLSAAQILLGLAA